MEIKASLKMPYTVSERAVFVCEQQALGYEIREPNDEHHSVEAWGYTDAEIAEIHRVNEIETRIAELKRYLADTDYVVIKMYEAYMEESPDYEAFRVTYAEVLQARADARAEINRLEVQLQ